MSWIQSKVDAMESGTLAKWLVVLALLYLILPYDLLPDFFGLPGRVDDVLIMGWLFWLYRSHGASARSRAGADPSQGSSREDPSAPYPKQDAYQILGVSRSASPEAIQAAYRSRMQEYHPDKVSHLGEELQKLATEKTQEIQRAYQTLRR